MVETANERVLVAPEPRYSMAACLLAEAAEITWGKALESLLQAKAEADLNKPFHHPSLCGIVWYVWLRMGEQAIDHIPYLKKEEEQRQSSLYHFLGAEAETI